MKINKQLLVFSPGEVLSSFNRLARGATLTNERGREKRTFTVCLMNNRNGLLGENKIRKPSFVHVHLLWVSCNQIAACRLLVCSFFLYRGCKCKSVISPIKVLGMSSLHRVTLQYIDTDLQTRSTSVCFGLTITLTFRSGW